jgi:hypothetical protein
MDRLSLGAMSRISDRKPAASLEGLFGEVLLGVRKPGAAGDSRLLKPAREVEALARRDYGSPLRASFDRRAVREFISEAKRSVWPHINSQPLRLGSPQDFRKAWSALGIEFRMANFSSAEGLALLGFYVQKSPGSKRPLICVNTAHHQAAMSAAFAHEMGHHLTSKMFAFRGEEPHLMGYVGYGDHLQDPPELAADILVSLGIFPQSVARECFDKETSGLRGGAGKIPTGAMTAVTYIANKYGFNADPSLSRENRLQYLAGVLHYARLREALLHEFGV